LEAAAEGDFAVLRDAGLEAARLAGAVREDAAREDPPLAFFALLPLAEDDARLGALPLRLEVVLRLVWLDFGCGIRLAPLKCSRTRRGYRKMRPKRIRRPRAVLTAEVVGNTHIAGTLPLAKGRPQAGDTDKEVTPMLERAERAGATAAPPERDAGSAALDRLLEHVMTTVQADRSLLLLRETGRPDTSLAAAGAGYDPSPIGRRFALDHGMTREVLRTGRPVLVPDYTKLERAIDFGCAQRPHAAMAAPVVSAGEIVGVVAAVGCRPGWQPGAEERELLNTGAELLGRALPALGARMRVDRRVAELHAELAAHDDDTEVHCGEVGELARAVGPAVGLTEDAIDELDLAAQLHDLGKTEVPRSILHKPGPLTPREWELVHEHPGRGAQMLAELPGLAPVGWVVRHHHERWDGTGYPDRLATERIPLGSRIIGACDAFLAMVRDRPYRRAMKREEAVAELHRGAGGQFDPRVVDALVATVA
jgi:HD-GYP domain-containing protein (c-di-GMP phosphodiesterase class II)